MADNAQSKKSSEEKKNADLGLLEEDDEFEEFPVDDWGKDQEEKEDTGVWEDNWDDDDLEDDFSQQLKAELNKQGFGAEPMQQA